MIEINKIYQGDALAVLKTLPSNYIDCIVTSPPYWALRDYGTEGNIWDAKEGCEHEWQNGFPAGDKRITKRSENRAGWERPSREEFSKRDVKKICPVCNSEFSGKPEQKFCSTKCLNTLSNEERQEMQQKSNFCSKCGAWKGQLGLEPTFDLYIKHLCDIFDEVKRVLKPTGTCWVNLGDTYASNGGKKSDGGNLGNKEALLQKKYRTKMSEVSEKSLCQIPSRFAIEMCNRGWILRNELIWWKPNCMPSSVKDRFTVDFEKIFFFVKSKKYYFETQYEPHLTQEKRPSGVVRARTFGYDGKYPYAIQPRTKPFIEVRNLPDIKQFSKWINDWRKEHKIIIDEIETAMNSQAPHHWFNGESYPSVKEWNIFKKLYNPPQDYDEQLLNVELKSSEKRNHEQGRNKRCVWRITTKPYKEAHFATYPEELCETPIKAGCPEFICKKCGKAREKTYEKHWQSIRTANPTKGGETNSSLVDGAGQKKGGFNNRTYPVGVSYEYIGYTDCGCNAGWEGGIVLDPFFGSGTTGLVAQKLGRKWIGIELNEEYIKIAERRLSSLKDNPDLFLEAM